MPCRPSDLAFQVRRTGRLPDRITCELPSSAFRARCTSDSPFFVYEMHTYARLYLIGFKVRWLSKYLFTVRRDNESKLAISLASNPLSCSVIAFAFRSSVLVFNASQSIVCWLYIVLILWKGGAVKAASNRRVLSYGCAVFGISGGLDHREGYRKDLGGILCALD